MKLFTLEDARDRTRQLRQKFRHGWHIGPTSMAPSWKNGKANKKRFAISISKSLNETVAGFLAMYDNKAYVYADGKIKFDKGATAAEKIRIRNAVK